MASPFLNFVGAYVAQLRERALYTQATMIEKLSGITESKPSYSYSLGSLSLKEVSTLILCRNDNAMSDLQSRYGDAIQVCFL